MFSNSFSFTVTSLLKMRRFFGSHAIHSILGYVACLFSTVPYACVVLHASSFKRKPFMHAVVEYLTHNAALSYIEALSISLTKSFKRSRPINLWELNPLDLAYQANSFTISELQLRVFQNGRRGEFRNPEAFALVPKTSPLPSTVYSPQKLNKTRLTFEFSRFGFKFAVCVF